MQLSKKELRRIIQESDWFSELPGSAVELLLEKSQVKSIEQNQFLFMQGDHTENVFCVISGYLRIALSSHNGQEFVLDDIPAGRWLGESAIFESEEGLNNRLQQAQAMTDADILCIPADVVNQVAHEHPQIFRALYVDHMRHLNRVYYLLSSALFYPLRARLASRLLDLLCTYGEQTENGMKISRQLSQMDFARMSMGSRQRVNKILREWESEGVLEKQGEGYLIKNIERLKQENELTGMPSS